MTKTYPALGPESSQSSARHGRKTGKEVYEMISPHDKFWKGNETDQGCPPGNDPEGFSGGRCHLGLRCLQQLFLHGHQTCPESLPWGLSLRRGGWALWRNGKPTDTEVSRIWGVSQQPRQCRIPKRFESGGSPPVLFYGRDYLEPVIPPPEMFGGNSPRKGVGLNCLCRKNFHYRFSFGIRLCWLSISSWVSIILVSFKAVFHLWAWS